MHVQSVQNYCFSLSNMQIKMAVYSAISVDSKFFLKKGSLLSSVRNQHSDPKQKPKSLVTGSEASHAIKQTRLCLGYMSAY